METEIETQTQTEIEHSIDITKDFYLAREAFDITIATPLLRDTFDNIAKAGFNWLNRPDDQYIPRYVTKAVLEQSKFVVERDDSVDMVAFWHHVYPNMPHAYMPPHFKYTHVVYMLYMQWGHLHIRYAGNAPHLYAVYERRKVAQGWFKSYYRNVHVRNDIAVPGNFFSEAHHNNDFHVRGRAFLESKGIELAQHTIQRRLDERARENDEYMKIKKRRALVRQNLLARKQHYLNERKLAYEAQHHS